MMKLPLSHYVIKGHSMVPSLKEETHVLSLNWFFALKEKDIVVAKVKNRLIIKRVKKIKGKEIYLVGDNEKESTDSRTFGWIKTSQVLGRVLFVLNS